MVEEDTRKLRPTGGMQKFLTRTPRMLTSCKSAQRRLGMWLIRGQEFNEMETSSTGVNRSVNAAHNPVQAFPPSLGAQISSNVGECTDKYCHGGTGRTLS